MCCPNGFQPYVFYGNRDTEPYSSFDTLPFISSIDNNQNLGYYRDKDLWLEVADIYQPSYMEPDNGVMFIGERADIKNVSYRATSPYNKHIYHGTTREICRACPGLFGKGVRAQNTLVQTEYEAEEYWWDFAAAAGDKKCAGQGVCDFYAKKREMDVDFMGDKNTWSLLYRGALCRSTPSFQFFELHSKGTDQEKLKECVEKATEAGAKFVGFAPESYTGGTINDMEITQYASAESAGTAAAFQNSAGWATRGQSNYVVKTLPRPDSDSEFLIHANVQKQCIAFVKCDTITQNSYEFNIYDVSHGRGDDRLHRTMENGGIEEASFDRFDTCFTYTKDENRAQFGMTLTVDYVQGQDPFVGGLCPRGYFCSQQPSENDNDPPIGYKEACPPGYFQPKFGATRTDPKIRCNRKYRGMKYEITNNRTCDNTEQIKTREECEAAAKNSDNLFPFENSSGTVSGCHIASNKTTWNPITGQCGDKCVCKVSSPCQLNLATFDPTDYVDNVCTRCDRHTWSSSGAFECHECPKGFVKKISGNFEEGNIKVYNIMPNRGNTWYYIENEMGNVDDDCARVPPGIVHIPKLNEAMTETDTDKQFLPLISCPYGFSNQPQTYIIQDKWDLSQITTDEAFMVPPFVQNLGFDRGVVSDKPCGCIAPPSAYGTSKTVYINPDKETCWEYARALSLNSTIPTMMDIHSVFWDGCVKFRDSNVVHWNQPKLKNTTERAPSNVNFFCVKKQFDKQLTEEVAAQYCFPCPGDTVTGPESGICTTCTANLIKKNMKITLQKIVDRAYRRLYKCYDRFDSANSVISGSTGVPTDQMYTCDTNVKAINVVHDDIVYKEENVQAWQFIKDTNSLWQVDSIFWPIQKTSNSLVSELALSDCILACSTTWGNQWDKNRTVRVGYAYDTSERNFCLCNNGGKNDTWYRYVNGEYNVDLAASHKYGGREVGVASKKLLWYQSQVEDNWKDKSMPLCGSCTPGNSFSNNKCELCENGKYTSTVDQAMKVDCQACPAGYYQDTVGQSYCKKCTVGKADPRESQSSCALCIPGYYGDQRGMGIMYKTVVPNGNEYTEDTKGGFIKCKECVAGQKQPNEKQTSCVPCTAGYFQNELAQPDCIQCPEGTAQPNENSNVCDDCVSGKYQDSTAQSRCKDCATGQYEQSTRQDASCTLCPRGYFANEVATNECKSCKDQSSTPDGNPYGFYDDLGAVKCKECKGGYTCMATDSTLCADGEINPKNNWKDACEPCTGNTVSNPTKTACAPCTVGKKVPNTENSGCVNCQLGSHSYTSPHTACVVCGFTQKVQAPTGCVPCPSGQKRSSTVDTTCEKCSGNQFLDGDSCKPCPANTKINADNTACTPCGGKTWDESWTNFEEKSNYGNLPFYNSNPNQGCQTNKYGPQVICYSTYEIRFSINGDACFDVTGVDDQVAIYWHRTSGTPNPPITVGMPEYFSKSGCGCKGKGAGGCACMTDYPYLMDYDSKSVGSGFGTGNWGNTKYQIGNWKKGQTGRKCEKSFWPGSVYRITIWYFNEDKGAGSQKLKISANDKDKDGGWRVYNESPPC